MDGHRGSAREQGTNQGPGAGCRAALSPTLSTPGGPRLPGGPQVGGPQAGVAGDACQAPLSSLSRHRQERSPPRPCKAPGNQKPHHLRDDFTNKKETERPVWDEGCWVN